MFKITANDGLARCGLVITKNATICTPVPMLYTRRGSSMYLTSDMLEKLRPDAQLLQINALQFLQQPSPEVLQQFGRGIHQYMGLPAWPIFASNRDPALTEYLSTKPASNTAAYVTLHTGAISVSPDQYMQAISTLQPDMFVALADEVPGDAKPKRLALSVDRTINWLDECIKQHEANVQKQQQEQQQQQQQHIESVQPEQQQQQQQHAPSGCCGHLFAPIVGGSSESERARSAKAAAEREVAGFALCGFGMGEASSARPRLLSSALQQLPPDKPRAAVGLDVPEEVLMAVAQGVDIFDCSYPIQATLNGYALSFPLDPTAHQQAADAASTAAAGAAAGCDADVDAGTDDTKLNLWSVSYRLDKRPLVPGCSCFTCQNHSRAYLHHLLQTHEMLAGVLLEHHNTHWWLGFFGAIQKAIQQGRLQQYIDGFMQRRGQQQQQQRQAGAGAGAGEA